VRFAKGVAVIFLFLTGCSAGGARNLWVLGQGGEIAGSSQVRAESVAARLRNGSPPQHLTFHILASGDARAYSWPDGAIYLTQGLMDRLSDDELAAAIAHECGHLIKPFGTASVVGLRGCDKGQAVEMQADAIGVQLLRANNIPTSTMAQMLQKVHDSADVSDACRQKIEQRIQVLDSPAAR
jgi:Zn-dependent protease with chaperone function